MIELNAPNHLISLATSAHLVHVEVKTWTATSQNRKISNEITSAKNADANAGRFTQNLLNNAASHRALVNHRQTVYNWLQRLTYDWAGNIRILPAYRIEQFEREYGELERDFETLKNNFFSDYGNLVSDAAFKQGAMFDRTLYPEIDELRGRFYMKRFVTAVPKDDFRSAISEEIAHDLRNHYETQVNGIVQQMVADIKTQLVEHATRLRNACTEAQADDEGKVKRKKIYESTFEQTRSMVTLIEKCNLTNDPELEAARVKLKNTLDGVTLDALRESSYSRLEVKDGLDDILSKFAPLTLAAE
jgi:hypothetical protein